MNKQMQPTTYLLTWNPQKYPWSNFQNFWKSLSQGDYPLLRWSCGNTGRITIGDRVFLMRLGWKEKVTGIVGSGWVVEEPFNDVHWDQEAESKTALYIRFEPDFFLNTEIQEPLNPKIIFPNFNWHPQRSGISIPLELAKELEQIWYRYIQDEGIYINPFIGSEASNLSFVEGAKHFTLSYWYERDPYARRACIEHYGTACSVCGFSFRDVYGEIGEGFIHIHHLNPISEQAKESEYQIDPIRDLRPVCPNCHAMLHRRSPSYSIEELKRLRKD